MNLSNIIKPHAEQNPDETAIIFEEHRITYSELDRLINRVAGGLLELGLKRGDVLSIFLPSLPELIVGERPIRIGRRPRRGSVSSALPRALWQPIAMSGTMQPISLKFTFNQQTPSWWPHRSSIAGDW